MINLLNPRGIAPTETQSPSNFLEYLSKVTFGPKKLGVAMKLSAYGLQQIKNHEGRRLYKYKDAVGLWTIGYGHLIKKGENFDKGITEDQAILLLKQDIAEFEKTVNYAVQVPLTQNQFDALVSLCFNIGQYSFKSSTLLKLLNRRQYASAADQFLVWCKGGKPLKVIVGLKVRRESERRLFLKA